jgi:SPP1 family predicted phage head-tail adaptor
MAEARQRVGTYRHHVQLQKPVLGAKDSKGQPSVTWVTQALRYCDIQGIAGQEKWQGQQVQPDVTHGILMRYFAGLNSAWRILWGTRTFYLTYAINPGERAMGSQMKLQAVERP